MALMEKLVRSQERIRNSQLVLECSVLKNESLYVFKWEGLDGTRDLAQGGRGISGMLSLSNPQGGSD